MRDYYKNCPCLYCQFVEGFKILAATICTVIAAGLIAWCIMAWQGLV